MAETVTFQSICRDLRAGRSAPLYLIHGEEGFYIDALVKEFEALVPEADRDFDLTTLYAPEIDSARTVENACRRYPMLGPRQVVILKEVQTVSADFLKPLAAYAANPTATTVLCVCFRGAKAKGAEFLKGVKAGGGVVFEAQKVKEAQVPTIVSAFIKERGLSVDPKALQMLCDFVGTDLSRLYNEVAKLTVTLGQGAMVTPEAVERNIGISKEYNNFELTRALAERNVPKVMAIYFNYRGNPKAHAVQPLVSLIFNLFANVLAAQYAPDKSERGLMQELGFSTPWQLKDVKTAMGNYNAWQVIEIIDKLREFECAAKGNGSRQDPYDLFFDLLTRILNPLGMKGVRI